MCLRNEKKKIREGTVAVKFVHKLQITQSEAQENVFLNVTFIQNRRAIDTLFRIMITSLICGISIKRQSSETTTRTSVSTTAPEAAAAAAQESILHEYKFSINSNA